MTLLLLAPLVVGVPARAASQPDPGPDDVESVDPASEPYRIPETVPPLTDEQALPVIDLSEIEGIWPEDIVEIVPGTLEPTTPDVAIEDASALRMEGAETLDVYGVGDNRAAHVALAYPETVNYEAPNGAWRDLDPTLTATPEGWTYLDPAGASVTLPAALSGGSPITIAPASGGRFTLAPLGEVPVEGKASSDAVSYPGAFGGATLVYTVAVSGLQERIVLDAPPLEPTFDFVVSVSDLGLVPNAVGGIDVVDLAGAVVATLPAPVAYDSSPEQASSTGTFALTETGGGTTTLSVIVDGVFLEKATYPVIIDPQWHDAPNRDGYTESSSPTTSYESNDQLKAGPANRSYLKFGMGTLSNPGTIVYDAQMFLNQISGGTGGVEARRVMDDWPVGSLTWNNQPSIGGTSFDTPTSGDPDDWWAWDLTELYQHYLDTSSPSYWPNYGVALTSTSLKAFYASDATVPNSDPVLYVTYNDLPNGPGLDWPPNSYLSESEVLTLSVPAIPNDPNGDDVMVSFQISDDGLNWSGNHLVFQSPFDDKKAFTVPSGVLLDGQTYHWRAVSRDVCDPATGGLCSLTDGLGVQREPNASANVRSFSVQLEHLGRDPRWGMWSRGVGNGMGLAVNQFNGNLFLDVPLGSYATPLGPIDVTLGYNSLEDGAFGLGTGWDLSVGPRTDDGLPMKLFKLDPATDADLKVRFQGGRVAYFPHNDGELWGGTSAMSGYVTRAKDDTWTLVDAQGGIFTFSDTGANTTGADLEVAKPVQSGSAASNQEFTYNYDPNLRLEAVRDPLDRLINLMYRSDGKLDRIRPVGFGAPDVVFDYGTNGRLTSITRSVSSDVEATRSEVIDFGYTNGLLDQVRDGVQTLAGGDGWDITYSTSTYTRVRSVTPPDSGGPATNPSTPQPWRFDYINKNTPTQNVWGTCLTDPRFTGTPACDKETEIDDNFQTQTQFSDAGLPVMVTGPNLPTAMGGNFRPVTTYAWDNHNNMVCERSPEANAFGSLSCTAATDGQGNYNDLDDQGLSSVYDYSKKAPYRMTSITHPAADESSPFPRLVETYGYDEGATFNGLWAEEFRNEDLTGTPNAEEPWTDLNKAWTPVESPNALNDPDGEHWGMRLRGYVDISDLGGGKKYKFRVFSDDGIRLSIEGKTILDCFGTPQDGTVSNCGTGEDVAAFLYGNDAPIRIEFSDISGPAKLDVRWNQGIPDGAFVTIAGSRLSPDRGIMTSKTYEKLQSGGATPDQWSERWTYLTDVAKSRRLPDDHIREDLSGATNALYKTSYTYNSVYGHVVTETTNAQDPTNDVVTTYTRLNGPALAGWAVGAGTTVSCVQKITVDTVPATDNIRTDFECDRAGRTVRTIAKIDAVADTLQNQQDRTTDVDYDSLGRVVRTTAYDSWVTGNIGSGVTIYDEAGRVELTKTLVTGTTWTEGGFVYDHAGRLKTEIVANPATGVVSLTSPYATVGHVYDLAGNETATTNELGKTWASTYDALNRATQVTSPMGAITKTTYKLGNARNDIVVDDPAGVTTTNTMDVLGRTTSVALEDYVPTTNAYDVLGSLTSTTDPAGIKSTSTYSGLGEVLTTTAFAQAGGTPASTTYGYDASGRLTSVDGPMSGAQEDKLLYDYDPFGRHTKTTFDAILIPGTSNKANARMDYNDAGEVVRVEQPLKSGVTVTRRFAYDGAGRQTTMKDAQDRTTTTTYNKAGWPTKVDDARSTDVFTGYDLLGRLVCRHTAAGCEANASGERFAYDQAGNVTRAASLSPAPTYDLIYDNDGRLWKVKIGNAEQTVYGYSATKAQLTSVTDLNVGVTSFTYNAAGQLRTLDDPLSSTGLTTYDYDGTNGTNTGRLTTRTDTQANLRWGLTYEPQTGRLDTETIVKNSNSAAVASFDLSYTPVGNVKTKASTVGTNASNAPWTYDYDGASRLIQATGKNAAGTDTTWDYTYDAGGNRTRVVEKATVSGVKASDWTTEYDTTGLATSATNAVGNETVGYTYDPAGITLTSANSTTNANDRGYTYDAFGRLTCAKTAATVCGTTAASTRVTYALDAFDRMFRRTLNKTATDHTYRGVTEQLVKAGTTLYALGATGTPIGQKIGTAAATYFLRDPHGDTVGTVSTTGVIQTTAAFDPYGGVLATGGTQPSVGFQSDYTDALTKQVDMGTRWYGPGQGRFSSRDVLFGDPMSPISMNQWAYGGANPLTMHDPTGMRTEQCTGPCDSNTEQRNATAYSQHSSGETWEDSYATAIEVVPPPPPSYIVAKMRFSDPTMLPDHDGEFITEEFEDHRDAVRACMNEYGYATRGNCERDYTLQELEAQRCAQGCNAIKDVLSFAWNNKHLIGAAVCIAASFGACVVATIMVTAATEVDLFTAGAPGSAHAANLSLAVFSLGVGGAARAAQVNARGLVRTRYAGAIPSPGERAFMGGVLAVSDATCAIDELAGERRCP